LRARRRVNPDVCQRGKAVHVQRKPGDRQVAGSIYGCRPNTACLTGRNRLSSLMITIYVCYVVEVRSGWRKFAPVSHAC